MPESVKSPISKIRGVRWLLPAALLGLLLACGGGGGNQDNLATTTNVTAQDNACPSVLSEVKTEACTAGQIGTHTFQKETASCSIHNGKNVEIEPCLPNTPSNRIMLALKAGDSTLLSGKDASEIISQASGNYQGILDTQNNLIGTFYQGGSSAKLSTKFDLVKDSFMIQPLLSSMEKVFPLVVGDKGNVLASVSTVGGDRIAGYGYDILSGFDTNQTRIFGLSSQSLEVASRQIDHQAVFKRVLSWLVTGDPARDLTGQSATSLNIAWSSLPKSNTVLYTTGAKEKVYKSYAADGLTALKIPFTSLQCDPLSDPVKDCAAKAQLVVIGAVDRRLNADVLQVQLSRIKDIVVAKIPVLYLNSHPDGGAPNDYARANWPDDYPRLSALGFASGDAPDRRNYYALDYVGGDLTPDQLHARNDPLGAKLLERIKGNNFNQKYDWTKCEADSDCVLPQAFTDEIVNPLNKLKTLLDEINSKGQNLYDPQVENKTLKQLVLWADAYRQNIVYPINKLTHAEAFQKAYIADALVAYVRKAGMAQTDLGNFLGPDVRQVKGSTTIENVTVTLTGSNGFTAVGRFLLPGQALTIQLQKAPVAGKFTFFVNTASEGNTKLFSSPVDAAGKEILGTGYRRPRLPRSSDFPLSTQPITIVSPYGGLLELRYAGTKETSVVLQIQGAAKHPFYDTTQGAPDASAFLNDVLNSKLDWLEIKTVGLEIHSLIRTTKELLLPESKSGVSTLYQNVTKPYFSSATNSIDMDKYLAEAKKYVIDDALQLAGLELNGLKLKPRVSVFCATNNWECTSSTIHKPRDPQHYHADDKANCGSSCNGNPITSNIGLGPRNWGVSHELGHNLVRFKMYGGISSEVANNIFPLHKKWRLLIDVNRDAIGYDNNLPDTQIVFDFLKKTFKDGSLNTGQKVLNVKKNLWTDSAFAIEHDRMRLDFYLQWPLLYADIIKNQNPSMSDIDAIEAGWDIYTLLYLNQRQVEAITTDADWVNGKAKLGFSQYTKKPTTDNGIVVNGIHLYHDYMLVALSLITGYDQRPIFDFWGIETSSAGKDQVSALRNNAGQALPLHSVKFYATRCSDDLRGYKSLDMTQSDPQFPWKDEFEALGDSIAAIKIKQTAHTDFCLSVKQ